MSSTEKIEVINSNETRLKKNESKKYEGEFLKSNTNDVKGKKVLSNIDDDLIDGCSKIEKYVCFSGLDKYLFGLKKKVNRFYFIYTIITIIHFLIYVNRGIIPGSYDYLSSYLKEIYDATNVDVHIGFLTSVFVFGLSINSILSGSLASAYSIFKITDIFLFQNSLALLLTGFSFIVGSYYTLMFSRFFCGFSEAAFITIIPPLIYSYSKDRAGSWISIFIAMFPLGGCVGYLLAVALPLLKISIAQYFLISGFVFFLFFMCFYLFDESLLKSYEDEKSRRELEKSQPQKCLEEGMYRNNTMKSSKSIKDRTKSKQDDDPSLSNDFKTKAANDESHKTNENNRNNKKENNHNSTDDTTNVNNKKENNNNNNNDNNNNDNNNNDNNNNDDGNYEDGNKASTNYQKQLTKGHDNVNDQNTLSSAKTSNISNLKNISSGKSIDDSTDNSKNKHSTDYSDHKSYDENFKLNKKGNMVAAIYEEDAMFRNNGLHKNDTNNLSFSSSQKLNHNDGVNSYDNENDMTNNDYTERHSGNNSYINNNLDKMYTVKAYGNDDLYLNPAQRSYSKDKRDKFLEIEIENSIETLDEDKNTELNLSLLVNTTITNISFLLLVIALTAHADMIQCYLVYGAPILYALNIFPSYKAATVTCSLCACLSSIIGTFFGGFLMDFYNLNIQNIDKNYEHIKNNEKKIKIYNKDVLVHEYLRIVGLQTFFILIIASVLVLMIPFISNMYWFTFVMTLGLTFLFSAMPGHNIGIMVCVPQNIRAFSIGMSSFISHLFGDIPWTIITGKIKGTLSPDCVVTRNGDLSEKCREQSSGLKITLLIICSKALIMALGSFFLYLYSKKKIKKYKSRQPIKA
ncbi:organic anion transporter [Plasmodium sp. DRC-Itaito]|nr:organic anion transporter [Plasmodium sp. DRC-Itaito]